MKKLLNTGSVLFLGIIFSRCTDDRSKENHYNTRSVCSTKLFIEDFTIKQGGAYGGDRVAEYLTDSVSFRKYIGTYDNGYEFYFYECKEDSIYISKRQDGAPYKIISTEVFSLMGLRKAGDKE